MKKIQNDMLDYICGSKYFAPLMKYANIMALLYPIYIILIKFTFLSFVWQYVGIISSLLLVAYYIGTIICFAENNLAMLSVAYGCMTVGYLLSFRFGFSLNTVINILFYGLLTFKCFTGTKTGLSKEEPANDFRFCPVCGKKCSRDTNFCNDCGAKLN